MDRHIFEFYSTFSDETPSGNFHDVIALNDRPDLCWEEIQHKVPTFCKGWYELANLSIQDRLEFLRDYWLAKLPFQPDLPPFLDSFFSTLDDIGVFIVQRSIDEPYTGDLVYSVRDSGGFYRGALPADRAAITRLQSEFADYIFPEDYLCFLQIHDGFCKATDITGLTSSKELKERYLYFQEALLEGEPVMTARGNLVEPKSLIPFYESFGMPYFQCFYADWYPEQEMGNVYFSSADMMVSDFLGDGGPESLAFPTFLKWLVFYLEQIG